MAFIGDSPSRLNSLSGSPRELVVNQFGLGLRHGLLRSSVLQGEVERGLKRVEPNRESRPRRERVPPLDGERREVKAEPGWNPRWGKYVRHRPTAAMLPRALDFSVTFSHSSFSSRTRATLPRKNVY